jgi:hypothetical protein
MAMKRRPSGRSVVKTGGIAKEVAEANDVTRDTYGDSQSQPVSKSREARIADADRAAGAQGIPGVAVPEPGEPEQTREREFRRAEISGDRLASRGDAVKARREPRS